MMSELTAIRNRLGNFGILDIILLAGALASLLLALALAVASVADEDFSLLGRSAAIAPAIAALIAICVALVSGAIARWKIRELGARAAQLRASETRYRSLIDSQGDVILHMTRDGRVTFANRAFEQSFGVDRASQVNHPLSLDILEGPSHLLAHAPLEHPPHRVSFDQKLNTAGGERWFLWESGALIDTNGNIIEIQSIGRDVTTLKTAIQEVAQARDNAEAANRAKTMFLATISHEIRTPMNGVLGMLGMLQDTSPTPEQRSYIRTADISGRALLSLIDEILDLSKAEANQLDLVPKRFSILQMVENVTELLAPRAYAKSLEIACHVEPSVPDEIIADGERVRQVLINLAGNALKFTETGGVTITVQIQDEGSASEDGSTFIRFVVKDTGIGIEPDMVPKIFDAFAQVESGHARRYGGTGLGLTISQRIIERLGGSFDVQSTPGKGSVFSFTIKVDPIIDAPAVSTGDMKHTNVFLLIQPGPVADCLCAFLRDADATIFQPSDFDTSSVMQQLRQFIASQKQSQKKPLILVDSQYATLAPAVLGSIQKINRPVAWLLLAAEERVDLLPSMSALYAGYLVKPLRRSSLIRWLASSDSPTGPSGDTSTREVTATPISLHPLRILLVEDNPINALLTRTLLERSGYQIRHVTTGASALAEIERVRHHVTDGLDLVLMDVQMPDMDGLEVTRRLRASESRASGHRRLPIIALTANAMEEDREECMLAGMDGYLVKPFRIADLEIAMQKLVRQSAITAQEMRKEAPILHSH